MCFARGHLGLACCGGEHSDVCVSDAAPSPSPQEVTRRGAAAGWGSAVGQHHGSASWVSAVEQHQADTAMKCSSFKQSVEPVISCRSYLVSPSLAPSHSTGQRHGAVSGRHGAAPRRWCHGAGHGAVMVPRGSTHATAKYRYMLRGRGSSVRRCSKSRLQLPRFSRFYLPPSPLSLFLSPISLSLFPHPSPLPLFPLPLSRPLSLSPSPMLLPPRSGRGRDRPHVARHHGIHPVDGRVSRRLGQPRKNRRQEAAAREASCSSANGGERVAKVAVEVSSGE